MHVVLTALIATKTAGEWLRVNVFIMALNPSFSTMLIRTRSSDETGVAVI